MLQGLIRILFFALLVYIFVQVVRFFQAIKARTRPPRTSKLTSGIMVKDEICNTYLPKEDAIKEIHQGKEYYFCSRECQKSFLNQKKTDSIPS